MRSNGIVEAAGRLGISQLKSPKTPFSSASVCLDAGGEEFLDICWDVAESKSASMDDLVLKARVLLLLVGEEKGDVADQLAASLARDVARLLVPRRQEPAGMTKLEHLSCV